MEEVEVFQGAGLLDVKSLEAFYPIEDLIGGNYTFKLVSLNYRCVDGITSTLSSSSFLIFRQDGKLIAR